MLQADSEKLRQAWVQAVQASIASAYRESPDSCYSEVWPSLSSTCTCIPMILLLPAACVLAACVCIPCMCVHVCIHMHMQGHVRGALACAGLPS